MSLTGNISAKNIVVGSIGNIHITDEALQEIVNEITAQLIDKENARQETFEANENARQGTFEANETARHLVKDLRNLYDGVAWSEYGYTLDTTTNKGEVIKGVVSDRVTDFIPVEPNAIYTANVLSCACFYDVDKNWISTTWKNIFTVPLAACYVRINVMAIVPSASLKELYLLKGSYTERPKEIGYVKVIDLATDNIINRSINNEKVEFNSIDADKLSFIKSNRDYLKGVSYETDVGISIYGLVSSQSGYFVTDYIAVKSGVEYVISGNRYGNVVGYTDEKTPLAPITVTNDIFTTPENCKYIRFSTLMSAIDSVSIFETSADQTQPNTFTMPNLKVNINNLGGDVLASVKAPLSSILADLIFTTETKKIKLIGDSITHGMGSSDFVQSKDESDFLFNAGAFPQYRNYGVKCWGGMLKAYLESKFNCAVTNNGASGATAQQLVDNWSSIVSADDDIIICMIGTNDRGKTLATIYQSVVALYEKAQANNQRIIFMSAPPTSIENETQFTACHMEDIDNLYNYVNNTLNVGCISIYKAFINYCRDTGTSVDSLLADGLHPNNAGYKLMFEIVLEALGFGRKRDSATW